MALPVVVPVTRRPRSRLLRTATAGAVCFGLGSLALVRADTVPPGHIHAIADASNTSLTAHVNAAGELFTIDAGTRSRLDAVNGKLGPLSFDGSGNLKVATQGANQITGTVAVSNFPATQQVAGTVGVGNFPATQNVGGSVSVSNLPAVQSIAGNVAVTNFPGTVAVTNFPVTQNVNGNVNVAGTVSVANFPPTQNVSGSVSVSNFPPTQGISGSVSVSNFPATQNVNITGGSIAASPAVADHQIGAFATGGILLDGGKSTTVVFGMSNLTSVSFHSGGEIILQCSNSKTGMNFALFFNGRFTQSFEHPVQVDSCDIICDQSDGCTVKMSMVGYLP